MNTHQYGAPGGQTRNSPGRNSLEGRHQPESYEVNFRIKYTSELGEDVFVIGDSPQLGSKSDLKKHPLVWTDGHIWVSKTPLVTSTPLFRYRYVMIDSRSGKQVDKVGGIKRIADLRSITSSD
jgi:hypothetical protein